MIAEYLTVGVKSLLSIVCALGTLNKGNATAAVFFNEVRNEFVHASAVVREHPWHVVEHRSDADRRCSGEARGEIVVKLVDGHVIADRTGGNDQAIDIMRTDEVVYDGSGSSVFARRTKRPTGEAKKICIVVQRLFDGAGPDSCLVTFVQRIDD